MAKRPNADKPDWWKPRPGKPKWCYCHRCGNPDIVFESLAEGHWCPDCGSSDSDE